MTRRRRPPASVCARQRGSITLWFLLTLTFLLAFGAFAVDVPRVITVRNELQNAADAAAMAGASALASANSLNWSAAAASATAAVPLNASDGIKLKSGTVTTGYWNLAASSPSLLAPSTVTLPAPAGQLPEPAVQVTITRDANDNGGLVALLLGSLLGKPTAAESATAVAVISPPSTVPAGGLFPVAMDQCVFNQYWNSNTNQPKVDPSTNQPYEFEVGNGQSYGSSCTAGQWTSFTTNASDVPTIRDLITNGNPTALSIGDNIYIEPGVKTTIYGNVPSGGITVVMPVVAQVATTSYGPILAFAAIKIDGSYGGSSKYIQGHFVSGYTIPAQASGVGTVSYGGYVAPRLAF
ncbi:pilus assembly protein TadG-related protein [Paraburkholderia sp. WSM4175]|uniref:pilus assembly protein TadG-related protein n=1 Tax=Paraburkholderia sp. WSM4175 TaxID=2991072 RepID=UPI003D251B8B